MNHTSTLVLGVACLALSLLSPWLGLVMLLVALVVGTAAVFALLNTVTRHLPSGMTSMAEGMTCTFVESLVAERNDDTGRAKLPAFITVRGGGHRSDFMQALYRSPAFKALCKLIAWLGPLPCLPACRCIESRGS